MQKIKCLYLGHNQRCQGLTPGIVFSSRASNIRDSEMLQDDDKPQQTLEEQPLEAFPTRPCLYQLVLPPGATEEENK